MKANGSDVLMRALREEGVDVLFGHPGGAVLHVYDGIYRHQFRHVLARHEQGAVHMADGFARATGRPGVAIVTSGPALTNSITGIATAYADSIPILRQAIELKPADPSPHYQLARALEKTGDSAGARQEFQRFAELKKLQPQTGGMASGRNQ